MAWIRHDRCPPRRSPDPWGPPSALRSVHLGAGRSPADAGRTRRTFFGPILPILSMGMSPDIRRRRSPPPAPRRWEIRAYRTATSSESPGTVHWDCSLGLFIGPVHPGGRRSHRLPCRSPAIAPSITTQPGIAGMPRVARRRWIPDGRSSLCCITSRSSGPRAAGFRRGPSWCGARVLPVRLAGATRRASTAQASITRRPRCRRSRRAGSGRATARPRNHCPH